MWNILLGVTGHPAAAGTAKLVEQLKKIGDVKGVFTPSGKQFADVQNDPRSDAIELRNWASCLIVAPLNPNTLAKFHHGICDNILTNIYRHWDWNKPIFMAPAMNDCLFKDELTLSHISAIVQKGVNWLNRAPGEHPFEDQTLGKMISPEIICKKLLEKLKWFFPLEKCNGIPINHHPGAFGFQRRKNHHTGVDLYCEDEQEVYAVEAGRVVKEDVFTGPKAGHDWWETTWGMMVEGASGVVNYGEILPLRDVGKNVERGQIIGRVKRVLFKDRQRPDIPGHSTSMLHLELYKHGTRDFADWHDVTKNPTLMDPTPYLLEAENGTKVTLTWENEEKKPVG